MDNEPSHTEKKRKSILSIQYGLPFLFKNIIDWKKNNHSSSILNAHNQVFQGTTMFHHNVVSCNSPTLCKALSTYMTSAT